MQKSGLKRSFRNFFYEGSDEVLNADNYQELSDNDKYEFTRVRPLDLTKSDIENMSESELSITDHHLIIRSNKKSGIPSAILTLSVLSLAAYNTINHDSDSNFVKEEILNIGPQNIESRTLFALDSKSKDDFLIIKERNGNCATLLRSPTAYKENNGAIYLEQSDIGEARNIISDEISYLTNYLTNNINISEFGDNVELYSNFPISSISHNFKFNESHNASFRSVIKGDRGHPAITISEYKTELEGCNFNNQEPKLYSDNNDSTLKKAFSDHGNIEYRLLPIIGAGVVIFGGYLLGTFASIRRSGKKVDDFIKETGFNEAKSKFGIK